MALTEFQKRHEFEIEQAPNFSAWCLHPSHVLNCSDLIEPNDCSLFAYYTNDGVLHVERVTVSAVVRHMTFPPVPQRGLVS